jgi:hypothetical protein
VVYVDGARATDLATLYDSPWTGHTRSLLEARILRMVALCDWSEEVVRMLQIGPA